MPKNLNYQNCVKEIIDKFNNEPQEKRYGMFIVLSDIITWLSLPVFSDNDIMKYGDFKNYNIQVRNGVSAMLNSMLIHHKICLVHEKQKDGTVGYRLLHPIDHVRYIRENTTQEFRKIIKRGKKSARNVNQKLLTDQDKRDLQDIKNNLANIDLMINRKTPTIYKPAPKKRGRPPKKSSSYVTKKIPFVAPPCV